MTRLGQTSVSMNAELAKLWKQTGINLGYGEKGMQKFLRVAIEIATAHPSLFRKR